MPNHNGCNAWAVQRAFDCAEMLREKGLAGLPMHLLLTIAAHTDEDMACGIDYDTLAAKTGWSRRACVDAVAKLKAAGIVDVTHGANGANSYRLTLPGAQTDPYMARSFADLLFSLLDEPQQHKFAAVLSWPWTLLPWSANEDLSRAMFWVFNNGACDREEDDPTGLVWRRGIRSAADPAAYLVTNAAAIIAQWREEMLPKAHRLADGYFRLLGSPEKYRNLVSEWPERLIDFVHTWSVTEILECFEQALAFSEYRRYVLGAPDLITFLVNEFPGNLTTFANKQGDSIEYDPESHDFRWKPYESEQRARGAYWKALFGDGPRVGQGDAGA
jgi:hypothetical protein